MSLGFAQPRSTEILWPQSQAAEQAVIGAVLTGGALEQIPTLSPEHFFWPRNAAMFAACRRVFEERGAIDPLLVHEEVMRGGQDDISMMDLLVYVNIPEATIINVSHYAALIVERAAERALIEALQQSIDAARDGDLAAAVTRADGALARVNRVTQDTTLPRPLSAFIDEAHDDMVAPAHEAGIISTGIRALDHVLAGLHPGSLITLAAQTGVGKTALALSIMHTVSVLRGTASAMWSLEMTYKQMARRLLYIDAKISSQAAINRSLDDRSRRRAAEARDRIRQSPFFATVLPGLEIDVLRPQVRKMIADHDIKLVVVDHLSIMGASDAGGRRERNRVQEVGAITAGLKGIALDFDIPVLALCQVNRKPEEHNHRLTLADLKDSSSIEQNSDVVLFIDRPGAWRTQDGDETPAPIVEPATIIVAKHRDGEQGRVPVSFHGKHMHYTGCNAGTEEAAF